MTRMDPEDLSTSALVSLVSILIPEHAKFIAGNSPTSGRTPPGKVLHLIRDDRAAN